MSLRSGGGKSVADKLSDFSAKQKAGLPHIGRNERSEDLQNLNAIGDNDALPVKSIPNYDVVGMPRSDDKLKNDVDDMRNAFGISQHKGLEQYDSEIDSDLRKIVTGELNRRQNDADCNDLLACLSLAGPSTLYDVANDSWLSDPLSGVDCETGCVMSYGHAVNLVH